MKQTILYVIALPLALGCGLLGLPSCDDEPGPENTGRACAAAAECYPDVDHTAIAGEVICMDRVPGGYCTHLCENDADCCAVEGECPAGFPQVCAPFENSDVKRCFLSCEPTEVGDLDESEYCRVNAHSSFGCRSTGGGSENRKVCVP